MLADTMAYMFVKDNRSFLMWRAFSQCCWNTMSKARRQIKAFAAPNSVHPRTAGLLSALEEGARICAGRCAEVQSEADIAKRCRTDGLAGLCRLVSAGHGKRSPDGFGEDQARKYNDGVRGSAEHGETDSRRFRPLLPRNHRSRLQTQGGSHHHIHARIHGLETCVPGQHSRTCRVACSLSRARGTTTLKQPHLNPSTIRLNRFP